MTRAALRILTRSRTIPRHPSRESSRPRIWRTHYTRFPMTCRPLPLEPARVAAPVLIRRMAAGPGMPATDSGPDAIFWTTPWIVGGGGLAFVRGLRPGRPLWSDMCMFGRLLVVFVPGSSTPPRIRHFSEKHTAHKAVHLQGGFSFRA